MSTRTLAIVTVFVAASFVAVPSSVLAQGRGRVIHAAPIFVLPDATRTPLRILPVGTSIILWSAGKEWLEVEWQDEQWGRRIGYIRAEFVELDRRPAPEPNVMPVQPAAPGAKPVAQPTTAKKPVSRAGRWTDRGWISVGGIYQAGSKAFSESFTFDKYVEQASVTTEYPIRNAPGFDVGGAVRVWRDLALGVSATMVNWSTSGDISGTIPHPFFFNASRPISGAASVKRTESVVHVYALWVVPAGRRVLVGIGAGPSFFNVKQSLVQSVSFTETYPYDTAAFASASVSQPSAWALGFNAEADISCYFSRIMGVGGGVRFTRASIALAGPSGSLNRDAGGFQGGVGLRIRLPRSTPATKSPAKPRAPVRTPGV